ncbi:MAG: hypothetical protein Q4G50_03085 [Corynebacterium sp.]|uniref:hypothetical protein n=1 Tax=Corynebacterium sp. TaxID=1720 RepID=UPI0026DF9B7D|nr:hypothetical protein [Corynebacterium sp.]MDO5668968.1 hypothetical protein [Corynebacterium sp.]
MRKTLIALTTATALTFSVAPAAHASSDVPEEVTSGSSGFEMLSSNNDEEKKEGALLVGRDWLVGVVAVAVIGTIIQAVASNLR